MNIKDIYYTTSTHINLYAYIFLGAIKYWITTYDSIIKDSIKATSGPYPIDQILEGKFPNYPTWKLRNRIFALNILPERCNSCGYDERRITDDTVPLLLDHIDGDECNHCIENLQMLCLNCYYQQVGNPFNRDKETFWNYNLMD